jgi:hypothetical protein
VTALVARALEDPKLRDRYLAGSDAPAADLLDRRLPWPAKRALVARIVFAG